MAGKAKSFEQNMERLGEIVKLLEKGDAKLDELLKLFEEGTALARSCNAMLDKAEQQVVILASNDDGTVSEKPFDIGD